MSDSGLVYQLNSVPWEYFGSLTFDLNKDTFVSRRRAFARAFMFLREVAGRCRVSFDRVLWVVRWEKGELGGLWHLHVLIGGTGKPSLSRTYALDWIWSHKCHGGISETRLYDSSKAGVSYILKCLNIIEVDKFQSDVEVSKSTWAYLKAIRRRGRYVRMAV